FSFHRRLSAQTLEIARNRCDGASAAIFLVGYSAITRIEASVHLNSIPLLSVTDVIDRHVIMLAPEEGDRIELVATAEHILRRGLALSFGDYPMFDANSFPGVRIRPAGGIASGEDSTHRGLEELVY